MDDNLSDLGLRVNRQEFWEFGEINDVEYEPLFRDFEVWLPYHFLEFDNQPLVIEPISSNQDSLMVFKPTSRELKTEKRELEKNTGVNFKVIEGMFVKGRTVPPVEGAQVTI